MRSRPREVLIAGAGPAALTAAILLARAGYRTRVFEARPLVGGRFHDDYQGLENWSRREDVLDELREAGIAPTFWHRAFQGGVLYDPDLRPTRIQAPRPLFYMVRRGPFHPGSLDVALLEQAREAGAEVVFGTRLDPGAAAVVGTGPHGAPDLVAAGITFRIDRDDFAGAILNDALAPAGYVYVLISEGQATLATVLFEGYAGLDACLRRSMEAARKLFALRDFPGIKHWGGRGSFSVPRSCERNGSLLVGEAGGFQDFLFGFGIRSALVSGRLAAQSIIEGRSYDALWRARLLPHMKASVVNRAIYGRLRDAAKKAFWHATGRTSRPDRVLRWLYGFSPVHRALYPLVAPRVAAPIEREPGAARRPPGGADRGGGARPTISSRM